MSRNSKGVLSFYNSGQSYKYYKTLPFRVPKYKVVNLELKRRNTASLYSRATEPPEHPGASFYVPFPDLFLLLHCTKGRNNLINQTCGFDKLVLCRSLNISINAWICAAQKVVFLSFPHTLFIVLPFHLSFSLLRPNYRDRGRTGYRNYV